MINIRKIAFIALGAVMFGTATYFGYREVANDEASDLLIENVEALTRGEGARTTWECDALTPDNCEASCDNGCNIHIKGTGALKGYHMCN